MFDFKRITPFCLSKHKMTTYAENLRGHGPLGSPYVEGDQALATPMVKNIHLPPQWYFSGNVCW